MFRLIQERSLPILGCTAKEYRHTCGLRVFSLETEDPENMFAITMPTFPVDNTGVTHILEHSILAGSRHYPVKDPFMQLIRSSMATFLNAVTFHDFTAYPVATAVREEFFTLADVYFDAVFFPEMEETKFQQEGWRYDFTGKTRRSRMRINGIVYNEMRGDYYELTETLFREMNRKVYKGSFLEYVSGGTPDGIPRLTYRNYRKYYREHYHPSRGVVFFYGNISTQEKLDFLERRLHTIPSLAAPPPLDMPPIPPMKNSGAVRRHQISIAPLQNKKRGAWAMHFRLGDTYDPELDIAFELLETLLCLSKAAPLRRKLDESGLGSSNIILGLENEVKNAPAFWISRTDVPPSDFAKLEKLVWETLEEVAEKGFSPQEIQVAFSSYQYAERSVTSNYLFGLMEDVFNSCVYGLNPMETLDSEPAWLRMEKKIRQQPDYLQQLIRRCFRKNSNCTILEMLPDSNLMRRDSQAMKERLEKIRRKLSPEQQEKIFQKNCILKKMQETPDSPKALATIPRLTRTTAPQRPLPWPASERQSTAGGIPLFRGLLPHNGISRLLFSFPLPPIQPEELDILRAAIPNWNTVGTKQTGYIENSLRKNAIAMHCSARIQSYTYRPDAFSATHKNHCYLTIAMNCLDTHFPQALRYLQEQIDSAIYTEKKLLQAEYRESWTRFQMSQVQSAYLFARGRAEAGIHQQNNLKELLNGFSAGEHLQKMIKAFPYGDRCPELLKRIFANGIVCASFLGSDENFRQTLDFLAPYSAAPHPSQTPPYLLRVPPCVQFSNGRTEFFPIASEVSACARAFPALLREDPLSIPLGVYFRLLSQNYLWEEVRVKGGAYGGYAAYDPSIGCASFFSTQDSNPGETMKIFDRARELACQWTDSQVEEAVISGLKGYQFPYRQQEALQTIHSVFLQNQSENQEICRYQKILAVTPGDIREAAEKFWSQATVWNDCTVGPESSVPKG